MQLVQTHLTQANGACVAHLMTWLPRDSRLKPGVEVELDKGLCSRDPHERWRVEAMYATTDSENLDQRWGLNLPKSLRTER